MLDIKRHPCFNVEVKGSCGRLHLPVAPKCNIMCNFCNRKYDCVNESRPGVTSTVLNPAQAEDYVRQVLEAEPRITVAGIAGPGDPFANPVETMETLRRIRKQFPDLLLCLASNGLGLPPYLDELADIGVSHVSITVNAIDPEIGKQIYSWIRDGKVIYRGLAGAELLLSRQLAAIEGLKARDIVVKVNTIVVPGINDDHVPEIAAAMAARGVDILNCMPLYPNAETPFAGIPEPTPARIAEIQAEAGKFLPQMRHCTRCRADAVGLLEQDRTTELRSCLTSCAGKAPDVPDRPYVAVATSGRCFGEPASGRSHPVPDLGSQRPGIQTGGRTPGPTHRGRPPALANLSRKPAGLPGGTGERHRRHPPGNLTRERHHARGHGRLYRSGAAGGVPGRRPVLPENPPPRFGRRLLQRWRQRPRRRLHVNPPVR